MSTRGVNFKFSVGEVVLCFEPDPSKAHVLYEAKILECQVQRDKHGHRIAGYLVHFQGWNSSWDRVVGEHYILKNNPENQDLMRRLADTARKQKNSQRRHKINDILRETFGGHVPGYSSDVDTSDTNDTDHEHSNGRRYHRERKSNGAKSKPKKTKQKLQPIELEIPEVLKSRLEDDYYFIEHQRKLTKLPAKRTVVDVLESFMKTFCINALCDPMEREREREKTRCAAAKDTVRLPPHNSINLCRELVDGLRVCFDFLLPLCLLYSNEREQYTKVACTLTPADLKQERTVPVEERPAAAKPHPPCKRRSTHDPTEEPEPKTATRRMTRRSHIEPPPSTETAPAPEEALKTPAPSTTTAAKSTATSTTAATKSTATSTTTATKAAAPSTTATKPAASSTAAAKPSEKEKPAAKPGRRTMVRIRRRLENPWDPPSVPIKQEPMSDGDGENHPPTQGAAHSDSHEAPGSASEGALVERKEDMLESILSWQILPPEVRAAEVTPSQVYGAFHLLRLFVKLPELLTATQWNEHHSQIQVKLLNNCLQFLMERQEEMFNGVVYEDA